MTDPIVDAVCAKLQSRSAVGLKKYGTTLADNAATVKEKLVHIQEELMDAANYVEWLLQEKEMPTPMTIAQIEEEIGVDISEKERVDSYVKAYNDKIEQRVISALKSPRVPVIEGLGEAIKNMYATFDWHGDLKDRSKVLEAARWVAELQKGV